ncbi:rhodanese-like domain-containing protein [Methylomonas sp. AM2-LC]|uniref:rhodanese-like domain-containing protein n=1 Tax=Methylomonas sp. AM2-LC TaxID=3153301 RepID=UPI0032641115
MTLLSKLFILLAFFSSGLYAAELKEVSNKQLLTMQQSQNALVIDIRTEAEWQATGIIPKSEKLQAYDKQGNFDTTNWLTNLQKLKSSSDQPIILVCRSGHRSSKVGEFLTKQGINNVYHLNNGIQSWIKSGFPVSTD